LLAHGRTILPTISAARGPESRTMPMPPPTAVAIAAIVSRESPGLLLAGATVAVARRDDDEVPGDALALRPRRQPGDVSQRHVHDAPVGRAHRVRRHRPPRPLRLLRQLVRQLDERLGAPLAIPFGIDADRLALALAVLLRDDLVDEVLQRIERLTLLADDE